MSERTGKRLLSELNSIARLPMVAGQNRLKRYAISATRAAEDNIVANHKLPAKDTIKNTALGCATGISAPPLFKWAKGRGYDLEA